MFGNKKNIPPRPHIPDPEHILEDLNNAAVDDVAFRITNKDGMGGEAIYDLTTNNSEDTYENVKTFLNVKNDLKQLRNNLKCREDQLRQSNNEIQKLANDIRKQAQLSLAESSFEITDV